MPRCDILCIGNIPFYAGSLKWTQRLLTGEKEIEHENNLMWKVSYIISEAFLCLHSNSCSLRKLMGML